MICRHMPRLLRAAPESVQRHVLHFESAIEVAARQFARDLAPRSLVLDAGAGEGQYAEVFASHRYVGVDLAIGDKLWNYAGLDALANLERLPFAASTFDACVNIVTLEHVREPAGVVAELFRVLKPGGRLLLVT